MSALAIIIQYIKLFGVLFKHWFRDILALLITMVTLPILSCTSIVGSDMIRSSENVIYFSGTFIYVFSTGQITFHRMYTF